LIKNFPWLYLVVFGSTLSLLLVVVSFTSLLSKPPQQFQQEPITPISSVFDAGNIRKI